MLPILSPGKNDLIAVRVADHDNADLLTSRYQPWLDTVLLQLFQPLVDRPAELAATARL
jgi:hypothetical protein